jgi:hypothetical protein
LEPPLDDPESPELDPEPALDPLDSDAELEPELDDESLELLELPDSLEPPPSLSGFLPPRP